MPTNRLSRDQWAAWGVRDAAGGELLADRLRASLLLPMGRKGVAFLAYPNFEVFLRWNQSLVYSTTAAYLATRLAGAPKAHLGQPEPGLSREQMLKLQQRLTALGHDVGSIDGILGAEDARGGAPGAAPPGPARGCLADAGVPRGAPRMIWRRSGAPPRRGLAGGSTA